MTEPRSNVIHFPLERVKLGEEAPADDVLDQEAETRCWGDRPCTTEVLSPEETARYDALCEFPKGLDKRQVDARVARMMALFAGKA